MKSKKGGFNNRRKSALELLEKQYAAFKAAKQDKKPRVISVNHNPVEKPGRSYAEECQRMAKEIEILKSKIKL